LKTVNLDYNSFERRASFTGTKFGGGGKKLESESEGGQTCLPASRNSFHLASLKLWRSGPTPFLFAHLLQRRTGDLKVFQNSAFGFSLKKVRLPAGR